MDAVGPRALIDMVFALGAMAVFQALAFSVGRKLLGSIKTGTHKQAETVLFAFALGLGVIANGVFLLGFAGWFTPAAIGGWLLALAVISTKEINETVTAIPKLALRARSGFQDLANAGKGVVFAAGFISLLTLIQTLTPPWDYDGLMYHLQAPRLWFQEERITLLPEIWQANGPMGVEMLFSVGLAMGSDAFAKLVNFCFFVLALGMTFVFARKFLGEPGDWIAVAVLIGIPILPIWGSVAYIDMALIFYQCLAVFALLAWGKNKEQGLLILSGILMGLAMGMKYLTLGTFGILCIAILWISKGADWKMRVKQVALFSGIAGLLAAPWYLKNILYANNPVYPFVFGGPGWDGGRLEGILAYLNSFGVERNITNFVLLPILLYTRFATFGTIFGTIDIPSILFPLVIVYPWMRRDKTTNLLFVFTWAYFALWFFGSMQTRFLLPIYPILSILVGSVFLSLKERLRNDRHWRIGASSLAGGVVAVTLIYQSLHFLAVSPHSVVLGFESKNEFLSRKLFDYPAMLFIQEELAQSDRVTMMWDGQGYYCDERCIPDADQTRLATLVASNPTPENLAQELQEEGATHILMDLVGINFFAYHDPDGRHVDAAKYFLTQFVPACADEIYRDTGVAIYEIGCLRE